MNLKLKEICNQVTDKISSTKVTLADYSHYRLRGGSVKLKEIVLSMSEHSSK